jgi:hypothetical protein
MLIPILIVLLAGCSGPGSTDDPSPIRRFPVRAGSAEVKALSSGDGFSAYPRVAVGDSQVMYVWHDNIKGDEEVRCRVARGGSLGPTENLSNNDTDSLKADVAAIGDRFGVVWHDITGAQSNYEIMFRYNQKGIWGKPVNLSESLSNSDQPRIVPVGDRFAVLWYDGEGGTHQVWIRFSRNIADAAASGTMSWEDRVKISSAAGEAIAPSAVSPWQGGLAVCWWEVERVGDADGRVAVRTWSDIDGWKDVIVTERVRAIGSPDIMIDEKDRVVVSIPCADGLRIFRRNERGNLQQVYKTDFVATVAGFVRNTKKVYLLTVAPDSATEAGRVIGYRYRNGTFSQWRMFDLPGSQYPCAAAQGDTAHLVWQAQDPQSTRTFTATVPLD